MERLKGISRRISSEVHRYEFSVCTFVTRKVEYEEMLDSFLNKGFGLDRCEYLYIDNCDVCSFDAYEGINKFLREANGKYIIICHQDVVLTDDNYQDLSRRLEQLGEKDGKWGICGNAGAAGPNHVVYHLTYPNEGLKSKGKFPLKVSSLDENFLILKSSAYLSVSTDLRGFHLYGTELCLQAELHGYSAYVIEFNLTHKSKGNPRMDFYEIRKALIKKYNYFFRNRWIQTNITTFHLSGSFFGQLIGNFIFLYFVRIYNGIMKRIK